MTKVMYPGSFDPLHLGHLHIVEIAADIFDEVVVVTMQNPEKKSFLSLEEREELLKASISKFSSPSIDTVMLVPLFVMTLSFLFLSLNIIIIRIKSEILQRKIDILNSSKIN